MSRQYVSRKVEAERRQAEERKSELSSKSDSRRKKSSQSRIFIWGIIIVIALAGATYAIYNAAKPGRYDSFAKCLTEKGAVMYGAEWCQYSKAQKGMFGKSFKYIDYRIYDEDPNIKVTPTWKINGQYYQYVQDFQALSQMTQCKIE